MSQALYRKYRSRSLEELVGQEHVTSVLRRAIDNDQIGHAYLLTGPRGVGKTSIARILAHEINGIEYSDDSTDLDIIEIDAASNRRIDDIRDLRERVHIAPSRSKYKVYIIDEVHMLTGESFNALLKTLEEPPAHVVFILATTEVDKLPATIRSRAQTFHFRKIATDVMTAHLRLIADNEAITIDDEALAAIALHAGGSMRDAETALDQVRHAAQGAITREAAETVLGSVSEHRITELLNAVIAHQPETVAKLLGSFESEGSAATIVARTLSRSITDQPTSFESLNLLDGLLDVPKSYSPELKLFSVLMRAATTGSSTPLQVVVPVVREKPPLKKAEVNRAETGAGVSNEVTKVGDVSGKAAIVATSEAETPAPVSALPSAPFDWDALIAHAKSNYIVLHSVLSKCSYQFDGETLTLYSKFKLHKMKLDDAKYRTMLDNALQSLTGSMPAVTIVFGTKPISDENLAGIAELMGGGEEFVEEPVHA